MNRTLTIAMATYDDFDGVFFTIQALRLNNDFCRSPYCQFVVYDANPNSPRGKETKKFVESIEQTYIAADNLNSKPSTFDKYKTIAPATGDIVLIVDCHVLLCRGFIEELFLYFNDKDHPERAGDLVQGPLLYDDMNHVSTHMDPKWRGGMFGTWSKAVKYREIDPQPFEIEMQGMGMCAFIRNKWPGILTGFKGFGGEEGYIAQRFRMQGGRNICHPLLRWNHRFYRPDGVPYPVTNEDRIHNYFLAMWHTQQDEQAIRDMETHFEELVGPSVIKNCRISAEHAYCPASEVEIKYNIQ